MFYEAQHEVSKANEVLSVVEHHDNVRGRSSMVEHHCLLPLSLKISRE